MEFCPFCKNEDLNVYGDETICGTLTINAYVKCIECGARGPEIEYEQDSFKDFNSFITQQAWDNWNRRA